MTKCPMCSVFFILDFLYLYFIFSFFLLYFSLRLFQFLYSLFSHSIYDSNQGMAMHANILCVSVYILYMYIPMHLLT